MPDPEPKSMPQVHANTRAFAGASFHYADLSGATFRDCDMSGVRIVSSMVDGLVVSGFSGRAGRVVVDDVDVSAHVAAELDRRHPERVRLREARTVADLRAVWADLESLWDETLTRAGALPEAALQERVNGEWSFVETLRHLVFAVDSWVGGWLRGEAAPFSPLALPPTDLAPQEWPTIGLDPQARPSSAEVVALLADRRARVCRALQEVTDAGLAEPRTATPVPVWGEETHAVGECLRVVLEEHCEHRRFAERDLAAIAAR
ncbi:MAG: DinB family protein [Geodermatophilales bacterium]|nr:DinB family protein [Geodermatophilales bacterium]